MPYRHYHFPQPRLYPLAELAWLNCKMHLPVFASYSPRYTEDYIAARLIELKHAEALPGIHALRGGVKAMFVRLAAQGRVALEAWQSLKRYISTAFPAEEIKARLREAGSVLYRKASKESWITLRQLMITAGGFLEKHNARLLAGNNMPLSFQARFADCASVFIGTYDAFLQACSGLRLKAQEKVMLSNKAYDDMLGMMLVGQRIFNDDPVRKSMFIINDLLRLFSAGEKAAVLDAVPSPAEPPPLSIVHGGDHFFFSHTGSEK